MEKLKALFAILIVPFVYIGSILTGIVLIIFGLINGIYQSILGDGDFTTSSRTLLDLTRFRDFGTVGKFNSCESCKINESNTFSSFTDFDEFNKQLLNCKSIQKIGYFGPLKLKERKSIFGISIGLDNDSDFPGETVFKCDTCGQYFVLSEPDNAWRGYFRKAIFTNEGVIMIKA